MTILSLFSTPPFGGVAVYELRGVQLNHAMISSGPLVLLREQELPFAFPRHCDLAAFHGGLLKE
jgi:hypothetical protein